MTAGTIVDSQALQADALDFLNDTMTYAISFSVIGMTIKTRATAVPLKAVAPAAIGLWIVGSTAHYVGILGLPSASAMAAVGLLAFGADLASVLVLMRYRMAMQV